VIGFLSSGAGLFDVVDSMSVTDTTATDSLVTDKKEEVWFIHTSQSNVSSQNLGAKTPILLNRLTKFGTSVGCGKIPKDLPRGNFMANSLSDNLSVCSIPYQKKVRFRAVVAILFYYYHLD